MWTEDTASEAQRNTNELLLQNNSLLKEICDLLISNNNLQQVTFEYIVRKFNNSADVMQKLREFELSIITEENKKNE
jgi:hypothetical protein